MGTYTRPKGTKYGVATPRCDEHDAVDAMGFAVQRLSDPAGDRCWAPEVGNKCSECGKDC
jgi:hypothetical protein